MPQKIYRLAHSLLLIYYETYRAKKDALSREKNLKHHGQGIRRLKERLKESIK